MIAFIPARSGSKSIKDKNIKMLGDKPLLAWTIQSAQKAGIEKIIVNTDSKEYADIAEEYGAISMIRPSSLAGDKTSMFDVLRSEIPKIQPVPDIVVLLQATVPFRNKMDINISINMLINNKEYNSVISVEKVPEKYNPAVVIIQTPTGNGMVMGKVKSWFSKHTEPSLSGIPISQRVTRRQDHPTAWIPTGSIYTFRTENLKKGSIYGENVMLLETESTININTQEDFNEAEQRLNKNN